MNRTAIKYSKHKSAQVAYGALSLFYGFVFFGFALGGWNAMHPDLFGEFAVSGEVEAWAGLQMSSSVILALGLAVNGRWRWSAALRFFGSFAVALICALLAYSASTAALGMSFAIYCSGFSALGLVVAWWNLVDLRAAMLWGGGDAD